MDGTTKRQPTKGLSGLRRADGALETDPMELEAALRDTTAKIGKALWAHRDATTRATRDQWLPQIDIADLEAIEQRAAADKGSRIEAIHGEIYALLSAGSLAGDADGRAKLHALYAEAREIVFPATMAYLRHQHELAEFSRSHSLSAIDLETLRDIDLMAHDDPAYKGFVAEMKTKLGPKIKAPNIVAYNQFFEVYGEALVLRYLRSRRGLKAERVPVSPIKGEARPDFKCRLDDGTEFYIEVKTLDIVGGEFRHDEMMRDAVLTQDDLQKQVAQGKRVAMSTSEIAPYRELGDDKGYDARSLIRPINVIRDKCRSAFKPKQFEYGPTFALAIVDRLVVPGRRNSLAPYYYETFHSGGCVSGVLWQVAFGRIGTPILRVCDFEGTPTLEGHLATDGLFADDNAPFPGLGLLVMSTQRRDQVVVGLAAPNPRAQGWASDEIDEALDVLCDASNDAKNTNAFRLSHSDQAENDGFSQDRAS